MKKIKTGHIIIMLFIVIIIALYIILKFDLHYPNIEIKVSDLYNEHSQVVCLNDIYYRINGGNIYNLDNQESIYQTTDKCLYAKPFDNLLWVVDNSGKENLKALSSSGEIIKSYSLPGYTEDFLISNNAVFCVSSEGIEIYKLLDNGNTESVPIEFSFVYESEKRGYKLYQYHCEYGECLWFDMESHWLDSYYAADSNYLNVISFTGDMNLLTLEQDKIVYTPFSFQVDELGEYSFSERTEKNSKTVFGYSDFFEHIPFYSDEKKCIVVAQITVTRSIGREAPVSTTCEMEKHKNDVLIIFNTEDYSQYSEHKTKTFERILYADSEKAITYYNGEYLTYSLEDWKVIDKQDADEIKNGGSYFFEACGEYLFVFDDKTDKLINKLKV